MTTINDLFRRIEALAAELTPTKAAVNPQGYADRVREIEALEYRVALMLAGR